MSITLPDDWESIDPAEDGRPKPIADAYVCKIVAANIDSNSGRLRVDLDIESGNYKGYFADDFAARSQRSTKVYWGLQFSIPINFTDPKNGGFYKRLFKRFINTIEQSNQNFRYGQPFDENLLIGKKFVGLVYIVEKPGADDHVYQNYRVAKEYTLKALAEGKVPESWIEDENGNKRKPGEPRPEKEQYDENGLCPVDDIDIPFD